MSQKMLSQTENIPSSILSKYNTPTCIEYKFEDEEALKQLQERYRKVRGLPRFVHDFLNLRPSRHFKLLIENPKLYLWSKDGRFLIMPNLTHCDTTKLTQDPKSCDDFALVAYYIYPKLLGHFVEPRLRNFENFPRLPDLYLNNKPESRERTLSQEEIKDLEARSHEKYLMTILDLEPKHLEMLVDLKSLIMNHLESTYAATNKQIELYSHFPYSHYTATLHFHIRVNQGAHPLEKNTRFMLDDIISCLKSGGNIVKDLVLERNPNRTSIYFETSILSSVKGVKFYETENKDRIHMN